MRILFVGAGAVGGYFGGRMLEAGLDVTFLVRPRRHGQLAANGLVIKSQLGDVQLAAPSVQADSIGTPWDLVVLSCKEFDLDGAIAAARPAVGPQTLVLPLLNGMGHLDRLDQAFGSERVLGGLCSIAATMDADGTVRHLNDFHHFVFGARSPGQQAAIDGLAGLLAPVRAQCRASADIIQEMWEKWVFLATLAAATCLFRGSVGDIVTAGGRETILALLDEVQSVAAAAGHAARPEVMERTRAMLTNAGSTLTASMLRDVEAGGAIEADHVIGDLLRRGGVAGLSLPMISLATLHLKTYDVRRIRQRA